MRRGELWTAAAGQGYAGKPRPVLIVQDDRFDATDSVTVCPLTTTTVDIPLLRIPLQPNNTNGLTTPSSIMIDKIGTVRRSRLGQRIGKVSTTEMLQLERGILVFLGMTG
ncbi:MAG: type II toxin-antitoxin system PemK/MazF family toxin [Mycobacterium sp.]|nr:type II toxin-antitoxin system PemK/MazF family toxin [Mycobacterium sp.]MCB0946260.1 type II toxin-antitoxin system PemK/MazF family toxin [Mycobacterium sp.]TXI47216.1 MAG: type II toxin-antitoxin system PemK/MazF family toxin [Mycobacterium sp.]